MKRAVCTLILLLATAGTGVAQVLSPTINYQGRAKDASDTPLTGPHRITLTIYDQAADGNVLFTEVHPAINFSSEGIFTVIIGGVTLGGIPSTIPFDQPLWMGVRIEGFNNGEELPRLRFHGSPFSFYANEANTASTADSARIANQSNEASFADSSATAGTAGTAGRTPIADSAVVAARAGTADELSVPVALGGNESRPILELTNKGTGPALHAIVDPTQADPAYAIVSEGVDSTTMHYVSAETLGNTTAPSPGGYYRDNSQIAWGQINQDGSLMADFGIFRVNYNSNNPGVYTIFLDNDVAISDNDIPEFVPMITPLLDANQARNYSAVVSWDFNYDLSGAPLPNSLVIRFIDGDAGVDTSFALLLSGRPSGD